jgi:hypothetical protein
MIYCPQESPGLQGRQNGKKTISVALNMWPSQTDVKSRDVHKGENQFCAEVQGSQGQ